jgi:hypothetical protein
MLGRTIGVLILAICSSFVRAQQPVLLGVMEDMPGRSARAGRTSAVQVMFQSVDGAWRPYQDESPAPLPGEQKITSWNVTFEGHGLGQVRSRVANDSDPDETLGKQVVLGRGYLPELAAPRLENASLTAMPKRRPLVVNSKPFVKDPDAWKPAELAPNVALLVNQAFEQQYPGKQCELAPAIRETYAANNEWYLVEISAAGCTNADGERLAGNQWFIVNPMLEAEFLGQGLWLVDAGDYDNDGVSELVFGIDRRGRAGYELFYDAFRGHVTYEYDAPPMVASAY